MSPQGPRLPRKKTALSRARLGLESIAFQIGVIVAIQRNRLGLTQDELAGRVGNLGQEDISEIENGKPARGIGDAAVDALFVELALPPNEVHANFVKWCRDNATVS